MIKTNLIIAAITSIAGTISAFTWLPPALDMAKEWANSPSIEAINELTGVIAQAKQWDIRTDELTEDVRDIRNDIKANQKAIADDPSIPIKYRQMLERQIESDMKKLNRKGGALDRATIIDQKILAILRGQASE